MEDLKKVISTVLEAKNPIKEILADKKINIKDIGSGIKLFNVVKKLSEVNFKNAIAEAKALKDSEESRLEVVNYFNDMFDISNKDLENKIESIVESVANIFTVVLEVIDVVKLFKK